MKTNTRFLSAIALAGLLASGLAPRRAAGETIPALAKPDASIAFLGDSITQQGAGPQGFYRGQRRLCTNVSRLLANRFTSPGSYQRG